MEQTLKKIRSKQEKELIAVVMNEAEPLPFKLERHVDDEFEDELYYIIPDDQREAVFKSLWPFEGMPKMDERLLDIHDNSIVRLNQCFVIRWNKRNIIVSPHYFRNGGTMIDLVTADNRPYYKLIEL